MGTKCSCVSAPQEVRPNTSNINTTSPTTSENRRFCIPQSPLQLDKVFVTTTTKYQHIALIEPDKDEIEDLEIDQGNNLDFLSYDVHETIDHLLSGFVRNKLQNDQDQNDNFHLSQNLKMLPTIKEICNKYYNHYLSPNINITKNDDHSLILSDTKDEVALINLLHSHWNLECMSLSFDLPLFHLELLFRASRDGIDDDFTMFHRKCDKKGKTLLLIQGTNNEIFGGFTSINYQIVDSETKCRSYYDRHAFLFNLTRNKIFGINRDGKKINLGNTNIFHHHQDSKIGIQFGSGPDLLIFKKNCCNYNINQSVPFSFNFIGDELVGRNQQNHKMDKDICFTIKEMEVFKVYGI